MKVIGKIIRWIVGSFFILFGLILAFSWLLPGVLCIASGLLLLPLVSNKLPEFPHKGGVLIVCSVIVLFVALAVTPETEESEPAAAGNLSNEVSQQTYGVQESSVQGKPALPTVGGSDKVELEEWLAEKLTQQESITDKERKKWKDVQEADFFLVWQELVLRTVESYGDDYARVVSYLKRAETVYGELYGFGENRISSIKQNVDDLSEALDENKKIRAKYGVDLEEIQLNYQVGTFYITQRLEQSYSDNILGKLEKEYDSYQSDNTSDWVAYDVEYVLDTPISGDTFRILHANSLNPFTSRGAYNVAYYDTGDTTKVSSSGGFEQEVPVYQLLEDTVAFENDAAQYSVNNGLCADKYNMLIQALGGEVSDLKEQDAAQYSAVMEFFIGNWVDINNEWLYMEIICDDKVHYKIDMSERVSSSEFIRWSFTCVYDTSLNELVYSDGKRWNVDQLEETLVYADGSGMFQQGEDETVWWIDDKEDYGAHSIFKAVD